MSAEGAVVVGSENAGVGMAPAMEVLRRGGSPLDAVVAGLREVERNPEDHTVGFSGLPNLLGEVELDASIMEGRRLQAGAVGALHGYQDATDLARRVMEDLPHVLVVGAGADRLAAEVGLSPVDLLTPEARETWRSRLKGGRSEEIPDSYLEWARTLAQRLAPQAGEEDPRHGTADLIARDRQGHLVCGVSTSGYPWKYPGRLGDSPIIGAGNFADDRWGAAACTGFGELSIRSCTAHSVVTFMRFGMTLGQALEQAMRDLQRLETPGDMNIVALDAKGNPGAISSVQGKRYVYQTEEMDRYQVGERLFVSLADR